MLSTIKQEKCFLLTLFFVALVLRALLFLGFTRNDRNAWIYFDSDQYHNLACQVAQRQGISNSDLSPQLYRLPGYSLFLAASYAMFGIHPEYALWLQIILSSIIPLLVFALAVVLFPAKKLIAKIAALISAIHLGFILYAGMLATESLFVIFILLFLIFFLLLLQFRWWKCMPLHTSKWSVFFAGLFLGVASLVRPVGHYLLVVAIMLLFLTTTSWRYKAKHGALLVGGWLIVVGPWLVRNFLLCGALFFHTLPGLHFLQYIAANVVAQHAGCAYAPTRIALIKEWNMCIERQEIEEKRSLNEYERCRIGERLAWSYACQHPWYTFRYGVTQLVKTGCGLYSAQMLIADTNIWPDYGKQSTWLDRIKRFIMPTVNHRFLIPLVYYEIVLFLLLLIGMVFAVVVGWHDLYLWCALIKLGPFMVALWGLTLAYGCARLRMPLEPLIIVFSAYGWSSMMLKLREGR